MARAIITLENAKAYLNVNPADTQQDDFLTERIDIASGSVEDYIENKVASQDIEEVLSGDGTAFLQTSYFPVISLVGATENDKLGNLQYRESATGSWINLVTDIDLVYYNGKKPWGVELLDDEVFPVGTGNVRIEYSAGYSTPPADIQSVVYEMVAMAWKESGRGEGLLGFQTKNLSQGMNVSNSMLDLNPRWKAILNRYRRLV